MKNRILSIICSALLGGLAYGQAGSLDPGFNSGSGTNGEVQAAVQQADGKTLIIGTFTSYDGTTRNRVARLEPDGTLDPSFDPAAGPAGGYVLAALEQSDGRILLAGEFTSYNGVPRNGIARLNADGSLDNSFDPGTGVAGSFPAGILAMALQPDGKIIVGGNFDEYNGTTLYNIARLNTDGSLDGSFDAVTNDYVRAIELQPDGKVLIGGDFTDAGGFSFWHIARLNTDGSGDLTFNPEGGFGPDYEVNDIERQPDGKILIVGYFSEYNSVPRMRIARLLPNGNLDTTFDPGISADDSVEDVSLQPDGKIFISGNFGNYQGVTRNRLARLLPDGTLDTTFDPSGSGANGWILQATALPGGKVLICGSFNTYDGAPAGGIARLRTASVTDMAFDPGTGPNDEVLASLPVGPLGNKMVIAGRFTDYDGHPMNGIARINRDGSIDTTFHIGSGANGAVLAIDTLKCGSLLVAGEFTTFNNTVVNGLVQLNPDGSIDTTFQWTFDHEAYDLPDTAPVHVTSVTVPPPEWIIIPEPPVVVTITVPDPVAPPLEISGTLELTAELTYEFTPLSGGSPGDVFTDTELTPDAGVLVVGHQPAPDGGTGTNLELITWPPTTTFDPVQTTDANGNTSTIDNVTVNTGGFPWGDYVGAGNNLGPDTVPEWKILVAGDFVNAGGVARNGIAQLNKDGSLDLSFDPGTGPNGPIRAMAVRPDGRIMVGGEFTSFNGVTRSKIVMLKPDGSVDESFDPGTGMDDDVNTISMFGEPEEDGGGDDPGCNYAPAYASTPAMFVAGKFSEVDGRQQPHATVLDDSQPEDCAGEPGGNALPGSACDDGDAGTTNDVYTADCACAGTPVEQCTAVAPDCVLSDDAAYQTVIANDSWCCTTSWDSSCQSAFNAISGACNTPAHDECADAIVIGDGVHAFSTIGTTGASISGCGIGAYADIWYEYVASCNGTATVTTCDDADFDTTLSVFDACGGSESPATTMGTAALDGTSTLNFTVSAGTSYWVRVAGYSGATGTGNITVGCSAGPEAPANDACANATVIGNGVHPFSTVGATGPDVTLSPNCVFLEDPSNLDVWFEYVAECTGEATASTCDDASFDTMLAVFAACGGDQLGCNDDGDGCSGYSSVLTFPVVEGQSYWVRVAGYLNASGTGNLTVSCSSGTVCPEGEVADCNGNCAPANWVGDGSCDDGTFFHNGVPIFFNCPEFGNDGGDCGGEVPENDLCENATMIGDGVHAFSTIGATGTDITSCSFSDSADIWYEYVATCDGTATATTCDDADYDTALSVFDACGGNEISCNDDGDDCLDLTSTLTFAVTTGTSYWVRVSGYFGATGTGNLTVSCSAGPGSPANDDCANATMIGNGVHAFSTIGATGTDITSCTFSDSADIWYEYVATCDGTATATTCDDADYDTALSVFDACGGNGSSCNDDGDDCLDATSSLNFAVSAGTSYWVRVSGYFGATGTGNLTVSCSADPGSPANDDCANATVIGNGVHPFSTVDATGPDVTLSPNCVFLEDPSNLDVWFEYVAECTGEATASTCDDASFDTVLAVFAACGGDQLGCNDDGDGCSGYSSVLTFPVVEGQSYWVRVAGYLNASGTGNLTVSCSSGTVCPEGEIADCNGNCAPANWVGDGSCDDGTFTYNGVPIFFNCSEFNNDEGDCDAGGCTVVPPACATDAAAVALVQQEDPYCCLNTWDSYCQSIYDALSTTCTPFCCQTTGGLGCPEAPGCEAVVCATDPFCCESSWDSICASLAADLCGEAECTPPPPCVYDLVLELRTDDWGDETSWVIFDDTTNGIVCSGSGYPDNAIVTETCCLADGCYRLEVYDNFGDGMSQGSGAWETGGYILRTVDGERIIDNAYNFADGSISTLAPGESFCLPLGDDRPIHTSCDRFWWTSGNYLVAAENPAVSAQFGVTNETSGYEFWFFDSNGQDDYSFRKFRNHATSDGFSPNNAVRAAHIKLNNWAAANHLQNNVLYNVRIRGVVNGDELPYGPACRVVLDPEVAACTPTGLNDITGHPNFSCGVSRTWGGPNSAANRVYARSVGGANKYEFEFSNAGEGYLVTVQSNTVIRHLNWSSQPALNTGSIYSVRVRASKDGGATWCSWGWTCDVTIAPGVVAGGENLALEGTGVSLWPNPNNGQQLWMEIDGLTDDIRTIAVDIHDLSGKRMIAREVALPAGQAGAQHGALQLDLNGDLAAGTYVVMITAGDQRHVERLVIAD